MTGGGSPPGGTPAQRSGIDDGATASDPIVAFDEAAARVRAPWAASVAGLLFAAFFTAGLILIRMSLLIGVQADSEFVRLLGQGEGWWLLIGSLYLLPFAGIMFLWFIAVIRDQLGEREDLFAIALLVYAVVSRRLATSILTMPIFFAAIGFVAGPERLPRNPSMGHSVDLFELRGV